MTAIIGPPPIQDPYGNEQWISWWAQLNQALQKPEVGSFTLIKQATVSSAVASVDFTDLQTIHSSILIIVFGLVAGTGSTIFQMRTSSNNGSSYNSGSSDYAHFRIVGEITTGVTSTGSNADSKIEIKGSIGSAPEKEVSAFIFLTGHSFSTVQTQIVTLAFHQRSLANDYNLVISGGARNSEEIVNAIRFLMSSGNIAGGEFRLYGIRDGI